MTLLSCREAQELLQAYHDDELSVEQQIAVEAHLDGCRPCLWESQRLTAIGDQLRASAAALQTTWPDGESLQASVISQIKAERQNSFSASLGRAFEDLHLVWAALGATAATVCCLAFIFAMLEFASPGRADSLAGILSALSSPGSNENPVRLDPRRIQLPRVYPDGVMPAMLMSSGMPEEDQVFALAAVLTREGRLVDLEVLLADDHDGQQVLRLLDAVSSARFEPARFGDSPIAVNMVWLLARTTVRGKLLS